MVSLIAGLAIMYLFAREFQEYRQVKTESSMYVDLSIGEKLAINFDVTFGAFPCAALHLDAMDISGYQQLDLDHDIYKWGVATGAIIASARADRPLADAGPASRVVVGASCRGIY